MEDQANPNIEMVDGLVYLTKEAAFHFKRLAGTDAVQGLPPDQWRAFVSSQIHAASAKGKFHAIYANLLKAYLPAPTNAIEARADEIDVEVAQMALRSECIDLIEGVPPMGSVGHGGVVH